MRSSASLLALLLAGAVVAAAPRGMRVQPAANGRQIIASASSLRRGFSSTAAVVELRAWNQVVDDWWHTGELTRVSVAPDALVSGRTHEQFQQVHLGVAIWSGDLRRQLNAFGQTESIFGTYYPNVDVDVTPAVAAAHASVLLAEAGDGAPGPASPTDLVIVPTNQGFRLAWTARVVSLKDDVMRRVFLDARSGDVLFSYDDTWRQNAAAYDMHGDRARVTRVLAGLLGLGAQEPAANAADPPAGLSAEDAQAALRTAQEFFLARFGRRGLAARAQPVRLMFNADRQDDAAYYGGGDIVMSARIAALGRADVTAVVAHELAHGITEYTSNLIYLNESGALNEAFSEIMAVSAKRYAQDAGSAGADDTGARASLAAQVFESAVRGLGLDQREKIERVMYRAFTALLPSNATFEMARWAMLEAAVDLYGSGSDVERALADAWTAAGR
ncbi:MAG TPA: M4 family metallopeptidase [Vicinamibacterales bacterium]|nr:M4 family metallopeptidase [Vicinamibacterales bacterium]